MKTITRFYRFILPVVAGFSLLLSSCVKDDHYYSIGDFFTSFGVIEKRSTTPNDYIIHLDDGNDVVPAGTSAPWIQISNNQRVWVYFNPLGDTKLTDSTVTYVGNIVDLKNILFKDIRKYTEVSDDSMDHDPIIVKEVWISKATGVLTFDLRYFTQGSVHYINLIDNGQANGIDNPFILELRHNARGDQKSYPASAYVSFKLEYLKLPGKNETKFYIRYSDYDGKRIDIPETYRY